MGEITPTGQEPRKRPTAEEAMPQQEWTREPAPTDGQPTDVGSTTGTSKGEEIPRPPDQPC